MYIYREVKNKMRYDNDVVLEELSTEKLRDIGRQIERMISRKSEPVKWARGGRKRILDLQLRAFKRVPSRILEEYMTEDEKSEYQGLVDSYS
jgi:hypothetical protein